MSVQYLIFPIDVLLIPVPSCIRFVARKPCRDSGCVPTERWRWSQKRPGRWRPGISLGAAFSTSTLYSYYSELYYSYTSIILLNITVVTVLYSFRNNRICSFNFKYKEKYCTGTCRDTAYEYIHSNLHTTSSQPFGIDCLLLPFI